MICNMCPRKCGIDREKAVGFCGEKSLKIARFMLHKFEEPIVSGKDSDKGSGAIFFSGCNMRCVFCQNYDISAGHKGEIITVDRLAKIFKELEDMGALNINLVSPTQFTSEIKKALDKYRPKIPIVWNSNGYESVSEIEGLKGYVDIFLVDLKYSDNNLAIKYSGAPNYFEISSACIKKMRELAPKDIIENGIMKKGMIVRQLVLPGASQNSIDCLKFICNEIGRDTIVSIMSQYEPMFKANEYKEINRHITPLEYKRVVNFAINNEMTNCFTQDLSSATKIYTPKF